MQIRHMCFETRNTFDSLTSKKNFSIQCTVNNWV